MALPESEVAGTHNSEEGLLRRLTRYRLENTEENTVLNYFDLLEIHPVYLCKLLNPICHLKPQLPKVRMRHSSVPCSSSEFLTTMDSPLKKRQHWQRQRRRATYAEFVFFI
jgi:hypothetical protein